MGDAAPDQERVFHQIHIDVARNATDDFNPFHDARKYHRIHRNPFDGPIVLGFQLECLVEYLVTRLRERDEPRVDLPWRNYQFTFADALQPGVAFRVAIKPTLAGRHSDGSPLRSNRVALRTDQGLLMIGHVRDSMVPLADAGERQPVTHFDTLVDRALLPDGEWFHKRKFMINSNAKNLLSGSLADQAYYFDELEDRIRFPDMYPASLISCALLERAHAIHHDFYADPMVYTSHHISVDRARMQALRSSNTVHILVSIPEPVTGAGGLGQMEVARQRHRCFGLLADGGVLFRAEVLLAPLAAIVEVGKGKKVAGRHDLAG